MTKGTLPPQAYTREMLTQAFQWVQTQPEGIRKLADSADALVGLFLRARRSGDANLENSAPVSTENFRKSLKTLATELEQFSTPSSHPHSNMVSNSNASFAALDVPSQFVLDIPETFAAETKVPNFSFQPNVQLKPSHKPEATFIEKPTTPTSLSTDNKFLSQNFEITDTKTRALLAQVQSRFNLSSENEALRLLISIGAERLEKL